jgi:hypothetical protein
MLSSPILSWWSNHSKIESSDRGRNTKMLHYINVQNLCTDSQEDIELLNANTPFKFTAHFGTRGISSTIVENPIALPATSSQRNVGSVLFPVDNLYCEFC